MKNSHIYPLPPVLVSLLESKHKRAGQAAPADILAWTQLRDKLSKVSDQLNYMASHEKLEEIARKIPALLETLNQELLDPSKTLQFQKNCYRLYAFLAEYAQRRQALAVTRLTAVDNMLHALQAHFRGNLPLPGLKIVEQAMALEVNELVTLYKNVSPDLPEEARQALLMGIDSFTHAGSMLSQASPESLKTAAADIRNGATLLQHLLEWKESYELAHTSPVPLVGAQVREMLGQLHEHGQINSGTLCQWVEETFWDLQEHWALLRQQLFMPRLKKDRLVATTDNLMLNLRDLDQHTPRDQEPMLFSLETKFEEISSSRFDVSVLQDHPLPWLADLFVAILQKGVPRYQIEGSIADFKNTDQNHYAVFLERYLAEDDRDYLLDALSRMMTEYEQGGFESRVLGA